MPIDFEKPLPLPLVVGVTGHRDLRDEDIPRLKRELETVFERLEDDYANPPSRFELMRRGFFKWAQGRLPDAFLNLLRKLLPVPARERPGATPIVVLSALAEGADQLVAEVATGRKLQVIAPLPLEEDEYHRDFEPPRAVRPDASAKFLEWVGRERPDVRKLFVGYEDKNTPGNKENTPENVRDGDRRDLQYRRAGAFIVRHCDVLIALWDGKPSGLIGGTAEIVNFKRHGIPLDASGNARASLDAPEIGPVIHIVTPRAKNQGKGTDKITDVPVQPWGAKQVKRELDSARAPSSSATQKEIADLYKRYDRWETFQALTEQSREFNRDAARLLASASGRANVRQSFFYLFETDEKNAETTAVLPEAGAAAPRYCKLHAIADALAQLRQKIFWRDWKWLIGIGLFAFLSFETFAHVTPVVWHHVPLAGRLSEQVLLAGYVAAWLAIFAWYRFALWRRHQERFLDYRALAEALRVAVFWKLAGIEGVADAYPIKMPRELAWVKTCLLVQELFEKRPVVDGARQQPLDPVHYDWIRQIWVEGQLGYFRRTSSKHSRAADWRERWSTRILVAISGLAAVLFALVLWIAGNHAYEPFSELLNPGEPGRDLFLFMISVLPPFAAYFVGYSEKLAFNAMARQYDRMGDLFYRALDVLPPELDAATANLTRDAIRELGAEAMRENAEWVSLYRQRPLSPHTAS